MIRSVHFLTLLPELPLELAAELFEAEPLEEEAFEELSPDDRVELIDPLEIEVATDPWEVSLTRGPL